MTSKKVSRAVYISIESDNYLAGLPNASALVEELVQKHKQEQSK